MLWPTNGANEMMKMGARHKKCKWSHSLDDALVYNGSRYCKTCRVQRYKYDWYRKKCKDAGVVDGVVTWNAWARELWGGPYKRSLKGG